MTVIPHTWRLVFGGARICITARVSTRADAGRVRARNGAALRSLPSGSNAPRTVPNGGYTTRGGRGRPPPPLPDRVRGTTCAARSAESPNRCRRRCHPFFGHARRALGWGEAVAGEGRPASRPALRRLPGPSTPTIVAPPCNAAHHAVVLPPSLSAPKRPTSSGCVGAVARARCEGGGLGPPPTRRPQCGWHLGGPTEVALATNGALSTTNAQRGDHPAGSHASALGSRLTCCSHGGGGRCGRGQPVEIGLKYLPEASGTRMSSQCSRASGAAAGPVAPPREAQPCECRPTRGWMWGAAGQHEGANCGVPWRVCTANKVRAAPSASSGPETGPQAGVGWPEEGIRAPPPTAPSAPPPPPPTPASAPEHHPHLHVPQPPS